METIYRKVDKIVDLGTKMQEREQRRAATRTADDEA